MLLLATRRNGNDSVSFLGNNDTSQAIHQIMRSSLDMVLEYMMEERKSSPRTRVWNQP